MQIEIKNDDANPKFGSWLPYSCDNAEWNDPVQEFSGIYKARICDGNWEAVTYQEDSDDFRDIFSRMRLPDSQDGYKFDDRDHIKLDGKKYYNAKENKAAVRVDGQIYEIANDDRIALYYPIRKYDAYRRRSGLNTPAKNIS